MVQHLRYEPLERLRVPRPVDRLAYVAEACRGRRVLDFGALDETAFAQKRGRGIWLHERIAAVAQYVVGVDTSPAVPREGLATATFTGFLRRFSFERGIALGFVVLFAGVVLGIHSVRLWAGGGLAAVDPTFMMRYAIPSVTLMIAGAEILFAAFVLSFIDASHAFDCSKGRGR